MVSIKGSSILPLCKCEQPYNSFYFISFSNDVFLGIVLFLKKVGSCDAWHRGALLWFGMCDTFVLFLLNHDYGLITVGWGGAHDSRSRMERLSTRDWRSGRAGAGSGGTGDTPGTALQWDPLWQPSNSDRYYQSYTMLFLLVFWLVFFFQKLIMCSILPYGNRF